MITRHLQVIVDLKAIAFNIKNIRKNLSPNVMLAPVIKADAYGHGAPQVAKAIEEFADFLCVATVDEAVEVADSGIKKPLIVMGGFTREEASEIVERKFIPFIFTFEHLHLVNDVCLRKGLSAEVILKFDTGMGRLGFEVDAADVVASEIDKCQAVNVKGIASHFAYSDLSDMEFIDEQVKALSKLKNLFPEPSLIFSIANSAGTLYLQRCHFSMVRPGLAIYGINPAPQFTPPFELKPAMTMKTEVVAVRNFPPGRGISYSHTFVTSKPTRVAIIACGYADGFLRSLSNRAHVLIKGERCPVIGTVCMDLTMVDITHVREKVEPWDEVVIVGKMGNEFISIEELARNAGTISYEIMAGTSRRVRKIWVNS